MRGPQSRVVVDEGQPPVVGTHGVRDDPPVEAVHTQLERILASASFSRSERLSRFLRFGVEEKIAGRTSGLKEYAIGTQVYGRSASFDPTTDTIVRVEARRLRATIEKYYANEGRADAVWISVPKGGYEPVFRWKTDRQGPTPVVGLSSVAVLPFEDFGSGGDQHSFCDGITEEIIHALVQIDGLHVVARTSAFAFKGRHHDVRSVGEALDVSTVVEGSVRKEGDQLRVTVQLVNTSNGYHLWSKRFDRDINGLLAIQDDVARAVANDVRTQLVAGRERTLAGTDMAGEPNIMRLVDREP